MPKSPAVGALVLVQPAQDEQLLRRERLVCIKEYLGAVTEECLQLCRQAQALQARWRAERPGSPVWISLLREHSALLASHKRVLREWREWWAEYRLLISPYTGLAATEASALQDEWHRLQC
jgi:hypothetical protein